MHWELRDTLLTDAVAEGDVELGLRCWLSIGVCNSGAQSCAQGSCQCAHCFAHPFHCCAAQRIMKLCGIWFCASQPSKAPTMRAVTVLFIFMGTGK